jgi:hypothetical protein
MPPVFISMVAVNVNRMVHGLMADATTVSERDFAVDGTRPLCGAKYLM